MHDEGVPSSTGEPAGVSYRAGTSLQPGALSTSRQTCRPGWGGSRGRTRTDTRLVPQLSLSRLNHRLPGREAHPEGVQGTADVHHQIADTLLPQADPVCDDATALDTAVDMLNAQSAIVQGLVGQLPFQGELLAAGFLGRHADLDLGQREGQ